MNQTRAGFADVRGGGKLSPLMIAPLASHLNRRQLLAVAGGASLALTSYSAARASEIIQNFPAPVNDPSSYIAYIPAACKTGQFYHYTCEFDAAWAVLKTFGIDASFEEQLGLVQIDDRIEPYYQETVEGIFVYGGDIGKSWCGNYYDNFLARCTGPAIRPVFKHYGLYTGRIRSRRGIQMSLDAGRLVWIKGTVDFLDWTPATWVSPEGLTYPVALGNDHSMIVMGYNRHVVVIRDVLGPTSSNWNRVYEYEVEWHTFMRCWGAQGKDGLAVGLS